MGAMLLRELLDASDRRARPRIARVIDRTNGHDRKTIEFDGAGSLVTSCLCGVWAVVCDGGGQGACSSRRSG